MKHSKLTSTIIGICIKIHEQLGPGLLESVYEEIICYELNKLGISFTRQQPIPVVYDNIKLELGFRADLIIENSVVVELKSIETIAPVHSKVVLTYLRLSGIEVAIN